MSKLTLEELNTIESLTGQQYTLDGQPRKKRRSLEESVRMGINNQATQQYQAYKQDPNYVMPEVDKLYDKCSDDKHFQYELSQTELSSELIDIIIKDYDDWCQKRLNELYAKFQKRNLSLNKPVNT